MVDIKLRLLGINMSKKNKKSIAKRVAKAQHRKKQKRKLRLIKTKLRPEHQSVVHPPMAEVDAPPGFRTVSTSQALMEYSKSIFNFNEFESTEDMNQALQLTSLMWNYGLAEESGDANERMAKEILNMIQSIRHVRKDEAQDLLDEFVTKRNKMFPPEVQVRGAPMMFMRKEMSHLISPFNYKELDFYGKAFPPDSNDKAFIDSLVTMDHYIQSGKEYSDWENEYFLMEKKCKESFSNWLQKKGATGKLSQDFPFLAEIFLNFVYRYIHDDKIVLKSIQPEYLEDFLFDHVLRKVIMEPHEHVDWPPALKLFYHFLYEKKYLENIAFIIDIIDNLEPRFIDVLRNRFSS
jgi:hypothetical protein